MIPSYTDRLGPAVTRRYSRNAVRPGHAVRAWLRSGGGLSAERLSEWFEAGTIRRWQRDNPGAAIWEDR